MNTGLGLTRPPIEITGQDMIIEHSSEANTDFVGHIQKLVPAEVGQGTEGPKDTRPFAYF